MQVVKSWDTDKKKSVFALVFHSTPLVSLTLLPREKSLKTFGYNFIYFVNKMLSVQSSCPVPELTWQVHSQKEINAFCFLFDSVLLSG